MLVARERICCSKGMTYSSSVHVRSCIKASSHTRVLGNVHGAAQCGYTEKKLRVIQMIEYMPEGGPMKGTMTK